MEPELACLSKVWGHVGVLLRSSFKKELASQLQRSSQLMGCIFGAKATLFPGSPQSAAEHAPGQGLAISAEHRTPLADPL